MEHGLRGTVLERFFASPLVLVGIVIAVFFTFNATWNIYQKEHAARERMEAVEREVEELEERKVLLEEKMEELNTTLGEERALREQFGVARPGEEVIVLLDDPNALVGTRQTDKSLWERIKEFFEGL